MSALLLRRTTVPARYGFEMPEWFLTRMTARGPNSGPVPFHDARSHLAHGSRTVGTPKEAYLDSDAARGRVAEAA